MSVHVTSQFSENQCNCTGGTVWPLLLSAFLEAGFPPLCGSISQVGDSEPTNHEKGFVSDLGYICPQPDGGTLHFKDMLTRTLE